MYMKNCIVLLFVTLLYFKSLAQQNLTNREAYSIIEARSTVYPKFYSKFIELKNTEDKIKMIVFFRGNGSGSPASAYDNGIIKFDISFIEGDISTYDDNRLVVVLFHEIGHLYYFSKHREGYRDRQDNEKYAFEYSLKKTKEMADNGDCMPLKTGLKYMLLRSQSNDLQDEHVRALKILVNEKMFKRYSDYTATCSGGSINSNTYTTSTKKTPTYNSNNTYNSNSSTFNNASNSENLRVINSNGNIMYYDINSPKIREQKAFYLYIVKYNSEKPKLRLCIQYSEDHPIFVTDYLINNAFSIHIDANKLEKTQNQMYNSWYDIQVDATLLNIIKQVVSSPNPTIKFIGTAGTVDYVISERDKKALTNILTKYISMTL